MNIQKLNTSLSREVDFFQELPRTSLNDEEVQLSNAEFIPYFEIKRAQKECKKHLSRAELIDFAEKSRSNEARGNFVNFSYASNLGELIRFRTCPADEEVFLLTPEALYVRKLTTLGTPAFEFRYQNHTMQNFDISQDGSFVAIACLSDLGKCPFVRVINRETRAIVADYHLQESDEWRTNDLRFLTNPPSRIITGHSDGMLCLWDLDTPEESPLKEFFAHEGGVACARGICDR